MPETQITIRYYPSLDSVITTEELPEILGFLKEAISGLLSNIHYKDLQYSKSVYGDKAFYSLRIVSKNRIDLEIPGTGIFIVLNPDVEDSGISSFPITVEYDWPILAYTRLFNIDNFSFAPKDFYLLALQILNLSEAQVVANAINILAEPTDGNSGVEQAIADLQISVPDPGSDPISSIINGIQTQLNTKPSLAIFATYILSDSPENTLVKLNKFYKSLLPTNDIKEYIQSLILPKFSATLALSAGIDFPRKILQPVDPVTLQVVPVQNEETGAPRAGFRFGEALFYASTESGVGYTLDIALSTTSPVMIGNTGLILEIERLKVDLSETENILEADLDGRPPSFQGVYAQKVAVTLPPRWFNKDDDDHAGTTAQIAGYDILIGNGGLSGTLALEAIEISDGTVTDYYSDCFAFQYPISLSSGGTTETIGNYGALISYLNGINGTSYDFVFPLSVLERGATEVKNITTASSYATFLASCSTSGAPARIIKQIGKNGFEIWFTAFDITFKQNKVTGSSILGGLKIPRLKDSTGQEAEIEVYGHFDDSGDFLVSASEKDGFKPFGFENTVMFQLKTVELGSEDGNFFIGCSCDLFFKGDLMQKLIGDQPIQIQSMRIYSDGSIEIIGGTIPVPANFTINLGPVEVNITNINLGSYQEDGRKYMVFGFDGAIDLGNLGFEARGKGMQFYFTVDDGPFKSEFRIQTIEADLIIPGDASPSTATAIINGYLSIPQPGESPEYSGGISINLPKAKIAGGAEMRLQPKYPAFIIDAFIELPVAIPIVPPVSISGFRGLLGFRYIAEKEAVGLKSGPGGDTWYDYYTYPKRGVNIQKFNGPDKSDRAKSGFSIGAGATLVTSDGTLLSARVMFILSIPSLFVFDGRANILGTALQLDDPNDPPFYAFIAIGDGSLELGAGIDFKQPKNSGKLITMNVGMEAYFPFRNSRAWYIHIGSRAKPNEARVFDLISLKSYLELSAKGMALGARGDFNFNKKFGPARVKAWAYVEVGGEISFERPQIGGYVAAGGGAEVKFWILTVGISIDTIFGAEVPKPFRIYASARVCGKIKIAFVKIKKCITVDIKWEKSKQVDRTPISPLPEYVAEQNVQGLSMLTGKATGLYRLPNGSGVGTAPNNNFPILPLDTYLDVKFLKPVNPTSVKTIIGGVSNRPEGSIEPIPPNASAKGRSFRQVEHEYRLKNIEIQIWNGSSWVNYHPYEALATDVDRASRLKIGTWQKSGLQYDALRILGDNPFSYIQQGEPGWFIPEQVGLSSESMFCAHAYDYTKKAHWETTPLGRRYSLTGVNPNADITEAALSNVTKFYSHQGMSFTIIGNDFITGGNRNEADYAIVAKAYAPNFLYSRGLQFSNSNPLVIKYTKPCREVSFSLTTGARGATFIYYKAVEDENSSRVTQEAFDQEYRTSAELAAGTYLYNVADELAAENTITQVKIVPDVANADSIAEVRVAIDQLIEEIYDIEIANIDNEMLDVKEAQLSSLFDQLEALEEEGCQKIEIPCTGISEMEINKDFIVGKGTEVVPMETQTLCETVLFEATWLTDIDYRLSYDLPDQAEIATDFEDAQTAIRNIVAPIWKPDAQYRLHFELTDTVDKQTEKSFSFYYGFATAGPVGHYPPGIKYNVYKNLNYEFNLPQSEKDLNPHTTLREYIDYKRSYPNADGNLLLSKPLFYGTEGGYNTIQLYYLKAYAYHMFQKWEKYNGVGATESDLEILVKDPVEGITLSNPPETIEEIELIPASTLDWTEENDPLFPKEYRMFNNLAQGDNCMGGDISLTKPKRYVSEFTVTNMKPQKLYTAIVNSKYKRPGANDLVTKEVHNFVFQTSRYMTFEEQVNSFKLKAESTSEVDEVLNEAVFTLETTAPKAIINSAYNIVSGNANDSNSKALEGEKLDLFDRVMDGLLEIPTLDPPATTEFNFIKNTETGNIVALLIRNPEPFNDPKIPLDVINGTNKNLLGVAVMSGSTVDTDYKILYAKDYSQLLVMYQMNNETAITAETLSFRFNYLQWNGSAYARHTTVNVSDILTTIKG